MGAVRYASNQTRRSRRYTPACHEELDRLLSGNALQLLLRVRRDCDERESDGRFEARDLRSIAARYKIAGSAADDSLDELIINGLVARANGDGYQDLNFHEWCRSSEERSAQRQYWRERKRGSASTMDSNVDSNVDSHVDSNVDSTQAISNTAASTKHVAPINQQAAAATALASAENEVLQPDVQKLAETWKSLIGRDCTYQEAKHFAWWVTEFSDRLSANDIAQLMLAIGDRQRGRGNPVRQVDYFDGAIREAHQNAKVTRFEAEPIGVGEVVDPPGAPVTAKRMAELRQRVATAFKPMNGAA
jgi:hypothetical protein